MLKRVFDVVFAAVALALLSPVLTAVAIWIKADSPGPVFFRQDRVGLNGRLFRIFKFRTMRIDAAKVGGSLTTRMDSRVTRSGHMLRRYKIDEIPQFINVLLGDMSVVGPRPEVPWYVAMYPVAARDVVLSVRPGVTDLASVKFRDESELLASSDDAERVYVEQIMPTKLALCQEYVRTRTLVGDMYIIWLSFKAMITPRVAG